MSGEDRLSELLDKIVNQAFNDMLSGPMPKYSSLHEYRERTGRRFRMTKKQTDRGLTREDSFDEFQQNLFKRKNK